MPAATQPRRIWWARPRKLCALERPGGGGRSHRAERRAAEIAYLAKHGVWLVVSTMPTRHNLESYDRAGFEWRHVPVASTGDAEAAFEEVLTLLRGATRKKGAVAVHGNHQTDFAAAVCAGHLHAIGRAHPADALAAAGRAGLAITPEAAALVGVDAQDVLSARPAQARRASVPRRSASAPGRARPPRPRSRP